MLLFSSVTSPTAAALLTALVIFAARICDVSIGTVRIISLARGRKLLAPVLGFFESALWLFAIRQIFGDLDNPIAFVAYAGGFATGTWVGMLIEDKLALGLLAVRIITREDASDLIEQLNAEDFGATSVSARGASGRVRLVFSVIRRRELERVMEIVERLHPRSFVSVSDVRAASEGIFPLSGLRLRPGRLLGLQRKGK